MFNNTIFADILYILKDWMNEREREMKKNKEAEYKEIRKGERAGGSMGRIKEEINKKSVESHKQESYATTQDFSL